jgi:hypothetical protein
VCTHISGFVATRGSAAKLFAVCCHMGHVGVSISIVKMEAKDVMAAKV